MAVSGERSTFKVGQMQDAGLLNPVVLAALKEGVVQVGKVGHDALALGLAQQHVVPLSQPVTPGRLLPVWVAVQDVVITLKCAQTTIAHTCANAQPKRCHAVAGLLFATQCWRNSTCSSAGGYSGQPLPESSRAQNTRLQQHKIMLRT